MPRISAATWPTRCRSIPLIRTSVWLGVSIVMPSGIGEVHRMREAERQVQGLALHRGAEADAHQLELALVALGDAGDHVGQVRARGAGTDAGTARRRCSCTCSVLSFSATDTPLASGRLSEPLAPLIVTTSARNGGGHALRQANRILGYSRHICLNLRPRCRALRRPGPMARAWRSVITPCGVETITVPMPPSTLGSSSLPR